ncbi:MAG: CaiB/BaiF CoA transferase family protein [Granulosicoccus sp.]
MIQKPLSGIRVLDLTNVLAGPFCCHQLVHLGAEVIKVETVSEGDLARQLGADEKLNEQCMGVSFLAQNAGKKSVTINLKDKQGKALFLKLVATADVLVENFRPGVLKRLGVDYPVLKHVSARLIYCAISGFGQDGPWVNRPAYDQIIQGVSGLMSVTGDTASGPLRAGSPVADTIGGMTAAFAICAALNARPRGSFIDVSMLESMLATMGWVVSNHLIAGTEPSAHGNDNPTSAPSGAFRTADGLLNIAANKDEQWRLLSAHLGLQDLQTHPDFATRVRRKANRTRLAQKLEAVLVLRPAELWAEELNAIGVPAGAVMTVPDILKHAQVAERGFISRFDDVPGVGRDIEVVSTGLKINGKPPTVSSPPPELGQNNTEIFSELGLSADEIQQLKDASVI